MGLSANKNALADTGAGGCAAQSKGAKLAASKVRLRTSSCFIFTGHCTPVERVEKGRLLTPVRPYFHVQIQKNLLAEKPLHLFARQCSHLLEPGSSGADDDALLSLFLHVNGRKDTSQRGHLVPL